MPFWSRLRLPLFIRGALNWIGSHELPVLIALFTMALTLWGFIEIAGEVISGDTIVFDEWMVKALRDPHDLQKPIGPKWLAEVARDLTALGGATFLMLLTITISGFLWLKRMYGAMGLLILAVLGGLIMSTILKGLFARPRPELVPHLSDVYTSSFPSGHSMLAATVYLTLGALLGRFVPEFRFKAYFLIVALILTSLVGASRVFMGVHYPTDVAAGWVAGLAWAILCWLVARYLQRRGAVENEEQSKH